MLYDLEVCLGGALLLLPIVVFGLAWARTNAYYSSGHLISNRQRIVYRVALVAASVSTIAYAGYWAWRICGLYVVSPPLLAVLVLEHCLFVSRGLSALAVLCFLIGRGPYWILATVTTIWVTLQLWVHDGIMHWA